jgi:hypothetical protein
MTAPGKNSCRGDLRLDDDRVELSGGNANVIPPHDPDRDRIAFRLEVPIEPIDAPAVQRERAHEVDERDVVERIGDGRSRRLPVIRVRRTAGIDDEVAIRRATPLLQPLHEMP